MHAAIDTYATPLTLTFGTGTMPIPPHHPAYSGDAYAEDAPAAKPRLARRWPVTAATIVGWLSVATLSAGAAHYMLQIAAASGSAALTWAATASAPVSAASGSVPETAPVTAPVETSAALPQTLAADAVAEPATPPVPPRAAAAPAAPKRLKQTAANSATLLTVARRAKPLQAATIENETLPPPSFALPAAIFAPVVPLAATPKASH